MYTLIVLIVFSTLCCWGGTARILGVFHTLFYSHNQMANKLLKELASRGHQITMVAPYYENNITKNFRQVVFTDEFKTIEEHKVRAFKNLNGDFISKITEPQSRGYELVETTLKHPNIQQLLQSRQTFDVVILEQFVSDALKGFCHHFKAPCVVFSPFEMPHWTHAQTANPDHPAYCLDHYCIPSNGTYFFERLANAFIYFIVRMFNHFNILQNQNQLIQKYFPRAPHLFDLYYNISLILTNTHISINPSLPRVPNMIEIGGFHINNPGRLPENLQIFLDDAKDGAILFSLGSHLRSKDLPLEKGTAILKVFSELKQRIIWKFEDGTLPSQAPNVKIVKWLPQQHILAHPNIKLFITHGGLLSIIEAVYYGVPILGIPIFGDQLNNVVRAEKNGYGVQLAFDNITKETFSKAVKEILHNPQYSM